ncbi:MAG: sigma-70 family RNA polymerase sigma factor [Vicinamibacterales bacterium]
MSDDPLAPIGDASGPSGPCEGGDPFDPESTQELVRRSQEGDDAAREALFGRFVPILVRWARGRLPTYARDLNETQDIVQDAVVNVLRRLDVFESRGEGRFLAYARLAIANRIRDEIRRAQRRPLKVEMPESQADQSESPLEVALGRQATERYERALSVLRPADREAIVLRLEMQYSYEAMATALGKPTANAARVAVVRAIRRLVEEMNRGT